jgi:hypothetical protein
LSWNELPQGFRGQTSSNSKVVVVPTRQHSLSFGIGDDDISRSLRVDFPEFTWFLACFSPQFRRLCAASESFIMHSAELVLFVDHRKEKVWNRRSKLVVTDLSIRFPSGASFSIARLEHVAITACADGQKVAIFVHITLVLARKQRVTALMLCARAILLVNHVPITLSGHVHLFVILRLVWRRSRCPRGFGLQHARLFCGANSR